MAAVDVEVVVEVEGVFSLGEASNQAAFLLLWLRRRRVAREDLVNRRIRPIILVYL